MREFVRVTSLGSITLYRDVVVVVVDNVLDKQKRASAAKY